MDKRETGTIKWYNQQKGYGFIQRPSGKDVFLHHSEILGDDSPKEGQPVEFTVVESPKGLKAKGVVQVEGM